MKHFKKKLTMHTWTIRFHQLNWYGCDLATQDRRYLAVGHITSGGRWEHLIVDHPELAQAVLSGTHLPNSKEFIYLLLF